MPIETSVIMQALAPGVALTSMIFYYGNLQSRLIFTTTTIRQLNDEARKLQAMDRPGHRERIESICWQVQFLNQRFQSIRKALLLVYSGFISSVLTILLLLASSVLHVAWLPAVALGTFALGFTFMGVATLVSFGELALAQRTIVEDVRSSYVDATVEPLAAPPELPRLGLLWLDQKA